MNASSIWYPANAKPEDICKHDHLEWHHFVVTRFADHVRVSYELANIGGIQLGTTVTKDVDAVAMWQLDPIAAKAWVAQRRAGWDGTAASLPAEWPPRPSAMP